MAELERIVGRYLDVAGTRTFFDEVGTGDTTIVCLHPAGSDGRMFAGLLPLLADYGYRVVAPDLPGHCRSSPVGLEPLRDIGAMVAFIDRFVEELPGEEPPVLLGTSMGGLVALQLLVERPGRYRALIGLEVSSWTAPTFTPAGSAERPSGAPAWSDALERAAISAVGRRVSDVQKEELRWLHRSASQRAAAPALAGWSDFDLRGRLRAVRSPVLLVKGGEDIWLPDELVDLTAAEIGELCEVERVEDLGHYPAFEDPGLIAAISAAFLARRGIS